jgi:puromycin-sensitive aminopeptidase
VILHVPAELAAYSNSRIVKETVNGDRRTVVFGPTMKMSTYLVAFVVGPFETTAETVVRGTPLRVITPVGQLHLAPFAEEIGAFALDFFSEYFDIPYPGEKLDLIAVPDFAFGAMENLGCVTFRETALLVDPDHGLPGRNRTGRRRRGPRDCSHVVRRPRDHGVVEGIWLNEAFATFMEILCVEHFRPQWKKWSSFGTFRDMALQIDGLHSTRPIEYEVVSPDDMRGMFDILTYEKGGSVLRMLEQYLGADTFRDGIRLYLRRHSYANTVTTDLWDALEEASGEPVREMMNTWILQGGHPLVTYRDGTVSQSPFAYGPAEGTSSIGENWLVPVLTRSLDGTDVAKNLLGSDALAVSAEGTLVVNAGAGASTARPTAPTSWPPSRSVSTPSTSSSARLWWPTRGRASSLDGPATTTSSPLPVVSAPRTSRPRGRPWPRPSTFSLGPPSTRSARPWPPPSSPSVGPTSNDSVGTRAQARAISLPRCVRP